MGNGDCGPEDVKLALSIFTCLAERGFDVRFTSRCGPIFAVDSRLPFLRVSLEHSLQSIWCFLILLLRPLMGGFGFLLVLR